MTDHRHRSNEARRPCVLYLSTRHLPIERQAQIEAAHATGLDLAIAAPSAEPYRDFEIDHFLQVAFDGEDGARQAVLDQVRERCLDVRAVVGWAEHEEEPMAEIAAALGLPGNSLSAARTVRNKVLTRKRLDSVPGANPRYAVAHDEASFEAALESVGVPCLIKPAGASGSRGIFRVTDASRGLEQYRRFRAFCDPAQDTIFRYFPEACLVEEEVQGTEHTVQGMVADGEVILMAMTDKLFDRSVPIHYQTIVPTRLPRAVRRRTLATVRAAVRAVGIDRCAFHVDLMVTSDGAKIFEIGGRLGGDAVNSHLVPLALPSLRPYDAFLQLAQGKNPFDKTDYTEDAAFSSGIRVFLPPGPGRIRRLEGFEKLEAHPATRAVFQLRRPGDRVFLPHQTFNAYALGGVVVQCAADEDVGRLLEELDASIGREIEPQEPEA